jgi:hypothetical protein
VHGGGFYNPQKYPVAPGYVPDHLHWFYWESYSTWLTGFALFTVLYLFNASTFLIDKSACSTGRPAAAVAAALGFLASRSGWSTTDLPHAGPRPNGDLIVGALMFVLVVVVASWLACQLFAGRAAFLLVGAMIATTMSGQRLLLDHSGAAQGGGRHAGRPAGGPGARPARQAAQRAQHLLHAAGAVLDAEQPLRLAYRGRTTGWCWC